MRTTLKRLSVLCAGAMLLACADLGLRSTLPTAAPGARAADEAYVRAREQHLARLFGTAIHSYQAALAADPTHVNARNGLATLYAEQGDFARAIPIWRTLTQNATLSSGPGTAFLFGNLGYAYFLSGDYESALAALEKACLLDPLHHRAWQHLGEALQKLGQDERAQQMFRQAGALREHDFRSDYAATGGGTGVAAIATAVKAEPSEEQEWATTAVDVAPDGTLALRRIPAARTVAAVRGAAPMPAPAAPPSLAPVPVPDPVRATPGLALLEIRNGNGVTGMAKRLSRQMGDPGLKVVRLTNEKGFNVRQTRVEYQPPFRAAAERLAERFGSARIVEVDNVKSSDMRLVIGRDLMRANFALRPLPQSAPALAVLAGRDKAG